MIWSNSGIRGALWFLLYAFLAILPLLVLQIGLEPGARSFWIELSVAFGFVGLSMLGLQFFLTARLIGISSPFGIDIVLQFHRHISLVAFGLILAHPIVLFVLDPAYLRLLNFIEAPWRAKLAILSVLCLLLIVVTSLWRQALRLTYETWKLLHDLLATGVILFGISHALGVGHYLALPWKQALWLAMSLAVLLLLGYIRIVRPLFQLRYPYLLEEVRREKGDAWTLSLKPVGHPGAIFKAGQFAWIKLGVSPFSLREHPFSFSSSAEDRSKVEFTVKELGDFTSVIKDLLPGTKAYLSRPRGVFTIEGRAAPEYVFIAGGIGITPVMSMLRTLADREHSGEHILIYASQDKESITFYEEIERLRERLKLEVVYVLDEAPDHWPGEAGFITDENLHRYLPEERSEREYFMCGPPVMMESVTEALIKVKVPFDKIHREHFQIID